MVFKTEGINGITSEVSEEVNEKTKDWLIGNSKYRKGEPTEKMEEDQTNWEERGENVPIDPKGIVFLGRSNCVTAA